MVDGDENNKELTHWEYKQLYDHLRNIGLSHHNAGRAIVLFGITAKSYNVKQLEDLLSTTKQYLRLGIEEENSPTRKSNNLKAETEITHEPSKKKLLIPKKPSKQSLTNALLNIKKKQDAGQVVAKSTATDNFSKTEKEEFNPSNFLAGNINYDF